MSDSMFYKIKSKVEEFVAGIEIIPYPMFVILKSHPYEVNGPLLRKLLNNIQPGDILLRRFKYYISHWFIPGYYTHAGLYVGSNEMIHMLGDGITKEDILTFARCDEIKLLRFHDSNDSNKHIVLRAIADAYKYYSKDVQYDFDFKPKNSKFYCTELIDTCFEGNIKYKSKLNEKYISPDDMMTSNLEIIL